MPEPPVRILVVDENNTFAYPKHERNVRGQRVFEVIAVGTKQEFIQQLSAQAIDLVLTDAHAFGLDDQQILDLIQENGSQPVVIFTASGSEGTTLEAMKRGAVDYVVEPPSQSIPTINHNHEDDPGNSKDTDSNNPYTEEEMQLASKAFENTAEGIFITNAKADIISINKAFTEITGFKPDEVLGEKTNRFKSEQRDSEFFDQMWATLDVTGRWQGEIWNRNKEGEIYPEWLTISTVKDERGEVTNYIGVFTDIASRKKSEERLRYLATHDPLTDLPNRDLFQDRLNQTLARARRKRKEAAVLLLDLDNFKSVNDTLGHSVGDRLLKIVAQRLKSCLRKSDTVARMGGDEFTFILEEIPNIQVPRVVANKILQAVAEAYVIDDNVLTITASIGISIFPDHGIDAESLLRRADIAMYRAKRDRNRFTIYKPGQDVVKS